MYKRKVQGSKKYFSKQIPFEIHNPKNDKIYKIKLFINREFQLQIHRTNKLNMYDVKISIDILKNYLNKHFTNIEIEYLHQI